MSEDPDVRFESYGGSEGQTTDKVVSEYATESAPTKANPYPKAKISLSEQQETDLIIWLDAWLIALLNAQSPKISEWAEQEKDYRAKSLGPQTTPFVGACGDV